MDAEQCNESRLMQSTTKSHVLTKNPWNLAVNQTTRNLRNHRGIVVFGHGGTVTMSVMIHKNDTDLSEACGSRGRDRPSEPNLSPPVTMASTSLPSSPTCFCNRPFRMLGNALCT